MVQLCVTDKLDYSLFEFSRALTVQLASPVIEGGTNMSNCIDISIMRHHHYSFTCNIAANAKSLLQHGNHFQFVIIGFQVKIVF